MNDQTIPSLGIVQEGLSVNIIIAVTQAQLANQGYTYNQAGFTYNQAGVQYGGVYNTDQDVLPIDLSFIDVYTNLRPSIGKVGPGWFMLINLD